MSPTELIWYWNRVLDMGSPVETSAYQRVAHLLVTELGYEKAFLGLRTVHDDPRAPTNFPRARHQVHPVPWQQAVERISRRVFATQPAIVHENHELRWAMVEGAGARNTETAWANSARRQYKDWLKAWITARWQVAGLDAETAAAAVALTELP